MASAACRYMVALLCCAWLSAAAADAADAALEARVLAITSELRCLVCQNETIAGSTASLAADLRREVREMLRRGASDEQIVKYMTDRYGDFVLYRPPFNTATALLWSGPALLLGAGLAALALTLRRRGRLADERFEPERSDEAEEADAAGAASDAAEGCR